MAEILIVEDDPKLRGVLASITSSACGLEARTFRHGGLALEYVTQPERESGPLLAFVDVEMPVVDGLTVLQVLKSRSGPSCVVVMSAEERHRDAAFRAGADYFLRKPFELEEILGLIDRFAQCTNC